MKILSHFMIGLIASFCFVSHAHAWIFSFSNRTNDPILVRIKLQPLGVEPWYTLLIQPKQYAEFRFTTAFDPDAWEKGAKPGHCLGDIQIAPPLKKTVEVVSKDGEYLGTVEELVKDPITGEVKFGEHGTILWKNVVVEYAESGSFDAIVNSAAAFAGSLQKGVTDILGAAVGGK